MKTAGVVAFGFGAPSTILSNKRIGEIASKKARALRVPVYTQLDVSVAEGIVVEYTTEHAGNPPPTLRIARGAIKWAKQHNITVLWVVAAKPHIWRVLRDMQQAAQGERSLIKIRVCKEIEKYPEDSWFCPDSTQDRVQSCKKWNTRERRVKIMPFWLYKLVAS